MSSVKLRCAERLFFCVVLSTSSFGSRRRGLRFKQRRAERLGIGLKSMHSNLERTDCYSWHEQGSSHWEGCGPLGLTVSPGISVSRNETTANYSCSFCEASSRSLGPTVSSMVKGAVEISALMMYDRCSFKTTYIRLVNLRATATIALRAATFLGCR